jgi:transposase InsO family protein
MPWTESTPMSQRQEFVTLAQQEAVPLAELCRRFGISRKTGYKWLGRSELKDRSRRPQRSPRQTASDVEQRVVELRQQHPAWGGRKIARRLRDCGYSGIPHPSTVTHILRRHGLITAQKAGEGGRYTRFEHPYPNSLWQMDFKGNFALEHDRCHPLTAIDDHSRYAVVLQALGCETRFVVQSTLETAFRRYGLPERMNLDNGSPWGSPSAADHGVSQLTIWLIRLGIRVSFSAPAHPQTNGKDERFHRTLKAEVLSGRTFRHLADAQAAFDRWRAIYNHERPHEALELAVPATRYQPSTRAFPETLPPIEYGPSDYVGRVNTIGLVKFRERWWQLSRALRDQPVAFRRCGAETECYDLFFCHHRLGRIDLSDNADV